MSVRRVEDGNTGFTDSETFRSNADIGCTDGRHKKGGQEGDQEGISFLFLYQHTVIVHRVNTARV